MDDQTGQAELQALFEMRRRVVTAFEDIATGVEAIVSQGVPSAPSAGDAASPEDVDALREALAEERMANAQLEARVRALHDRGEGRAEQAEAEASALRGRLAAAEADAARAREEMEAVLAELVPLLQEAV